eukprot:680138-Pelagomonas_calceolata.AAC.3
MSSIKTPCLPRQHQSLGLTSAVLGGQACLSTIKPQTCLSSARRCGLPHQHQHFRLVSALKRYMRLVPAAPRSVDCLCSCCRKLLRTAVTRTQLTCSSAAQQATCPHDDEQSVDNAATA